MDRLNLSQLSDKDLHDELDKIKISPVFDAFFIGFLIGILIFSAASSTWGLVSLVPLFLIYLFLKKPGRHKALKSEIEKRHLGSSE